MIFFDEISINNFFLNKTALHFAVVNENAEIVQLLLASEKIDTNIIFISNKT